LSEELLGDNIIMISAAKAKTIRTLIDTVDHHSVLDLESKFMYVDPEISWIVQCF
jgi:hypothetical protein